jgi:hypothetical protein
MRKVARTFARDRLKSRPGAPFEVLIMAHARDSHPYLNRDPEICQRVTMRAPAMHAESILAHDAEVLPTSAHDAPTRPPPMHRVLGIRKASIRPPRLPSIALEECGFDPSRDPRAER